MAQTFKISSKVVWIINSIANGLEALDMIRLDMIYMLTQTDKVKDLVLVFDRSESEPSLIFIQ